MKINIDGLLIGFVIVILGITAVGVIAGQVSTTVNPTSVSGESLSIAPARIAANNINTSYNFTLANAGLADAGGWVENSVVITNSSGYSIVGNYTVDYVNDKIRFSNNTFMVAWVNNGTLVNYQYYQAGYLQQSFARNTLNLTPGIYVLLILIGIIALLYVFVRNINQ